MRKNTPMTYALSTDSRDEMKDVPLRCSAYRPYGCFCGRLVPFLGRAPANASDAWWLPKPCWYLYGSLGVGCDKWPSTAVWWRPSSLMSRLPMLEG